MFVEITNTPRDYAWGRTGQITELLTGTASDAVEAELWLGAHHGSPSRAVDPASLQGHADLASAVEAIPEITAGTGRFPFLLKVLAAGTPLSLQAHPTAEQAREGFERENAAGIPIDASHRNYKDPHPKPELIVALTERFEALSGFRPAAEARADVEAIAGDPAVVQALTARLDSDATIGDAFVWLLSGAPEVAPIVQAVTAGALADPDRWRIPAWIAGLYPGDPGIVGALLLHHVVLGRGEALYLPAGNIHAYLDGVGIELMNASDNVLRGGLTPKHVDVAELASVVERAAGPAPLLAPIELAAGVREYRPEDPAASFRLVRLDSEQVVHASVGLKGPAIALCLGGAFSMTGERGEVSISRGQAVLVTPEERELSVTGSGLLFVAR